MKNICTAVALVALVTSALAAPLGDILLTAPDGRKIKIIGTTFESAKSDGVETRIAMIDLFDKRGAEQGRTSVAVIGCVPSKRTADTKRLLEIGGDPANVQPWQPGGGRVFDQIGEAICQGSSKFLKLR